MKSEQQLFTIEQFTTEIAPMSRAAFYAQVNAGRLATVRIGRRRYIAASEVERFLARLSEANDAGHGGAA